MKRLVALSHVLSLTAPIFSPVGRAGEAPAAADAWLASQQKETQESIEYFGNVRNVATAAGVGGTATSVVSLGYGTRQWGRGTVQGNKLAGFGLIGGVLVAIPPYFAATASQKDLKIARAYADDLSVKRKALSKQLLLESEKSSGETRPKSLAAEATEAPLGTSSGASATDAK